MNSSRIFELYTLAAYEFPETARWMPKWFTENPAFKNKKENTVFKIFDKFGIKDFREEITDTSAVDNFKSLLINDLSNVDATAATLPESIHISQLREVVHGLINELSSPIVWNSNKHRITKQVSSKDKRFRIDAGTSVVKAYNIVKVHAERLNIFIKSIEDTNQFKNYSKRGQLTIVFSSKPEDIAAMSSRSEWGSCQTLRDDRGLNACLIGSTLSKFVGIMYVTSGSDYMGRGEKMIARSLIRFAVDTTNRKPSLIIDEMYPSHSETLSNIMKTTLSKRTSVQIFDVTELSYSNDFARFRIPSEKIPFMEYSEKSYLDKQELFTDKESVIKNPERFCNEYISSVSGWLALKMADFISKHMDIKFKDINSYATEISKKIVLKVLQPAVLSIISYYHESNKWMHIRLIKKILTQEIEKPIQKIKIVKIITQTEINDSKFAEKLIDYIFSQLMNLPDEYVI